MLAYAARDDWRRLLTGVWLCVGSLLMPSTLLMPSRNRAHRNREHTQRYQGNWVHHVCMLHSPCPPAEGTLHIIAVSPTTAALTAACLCLRLRSTFDPHTWTRKVIRTQGHAARRVSVDRDSVPQVTAVDPVGRSIGRSVSDLLSTADAHDGDLCDCSRCERGVVRSLVTLVAHTAHTPVVSCHGVTLSHCT